MSKISVIRICKDILLIRGAVSLAEQRALIVYFSQEKSIQWKHENIKKETSAATAEEVELLHSATAEEVAAHCGKSWIRSYLPIGNEEAPHKTLQEIFLRMANFLDAWRKEHQEGRGDCIDLRKQTSPKKEISRVAEKPFWSPTHVLALFYPTSVGVDWHRDVEKTIPEAVAMDLTMPVVSLSLGNACIFEFFEDRSRQKSQLSSVLLQSGDWLVFGRSQSSMMHRVKEIFLNSFEKGFNARLNLTFRCQKTQNNILQSLSQSISVAPLQEGHENYCQN